MLSAEAQATILTATDGIRRLAAGLAKNNWPTTGEALHQRALAIERAVLESSHPKRETINVMDTVAAKFNALIAAESSQPVGPVGQEDERIAFEAHMADRHPSLPLTRDADSLEWPEQGHRYVEYLPDLLWSTWQAARAALPVPPAGGEPLEVLRELVAAQAACDQATRELREKMKAGGWVTHTMPSPETIRWEAAWGRARLLAGSEDTPEARG